MYILSTDIHICQICDGIFRIATDGEHVDDTVRGNKFRLEGTGLFNGFQNGSALDNRISGIFQR